ncbi:NAD(P)H-dependent oxidoreductase [Xylanibacter caecicola]|uniref:NAD(P)H-dependent oxidoreductase n=1 Tax=Xylanibacter caecicola TaxID=2736294 RepID=UPI0025827DCF|nr:NAD(P)H-dependent oxidoreductase [Xylanibacter caecicola]
MKKVLIISGHTDLRTSVANKAILEVLANKLPNAEIAELDSLYPDFNIDVKAEQRRLIGADIIVLQFPIFWYSAPSLLERWMEATFLFGFSHGDNGDKLKGKKLILSFTSGAPEDMYTHDGWIGYTPDEFMSCFKATCKLCGIEYAGHVYTGGVSYAARTSPELAESQKEKSVKHAERLLELLKTL